MAFELRYFSDELKLPKPVQKILLESMENVLAEAKRWGKILLIQLDKRHSFQMQNTWRCLLNHQKVDAVHFQKVNFSVLSTLNSFGNVIGLTLELISCYLIF